MQYLFRLFLHKLSPFTGGGAATPGGDEAFFELGTPRPQAHHLGLPLVLRFALLSSGATLEQSPFLWLTSGGGGGGGDRLHVLSRGIVLFLLSNGIVWASEERSLRRQGRLSLVPVHSNEQAETAVRKLSVTITNGYEVNIRESGHVLRP